MTVYLDFATVAGINLEHGGPGAGVREREGIEGAIARPYSTGFGRDNYPDLWSKAAAYLHGLCSTQYFHDGNKRTAWLVAVTFLRENHYRLPTISDVEAEAFVLAVAKELFTNPDEPDRTIEQAAEWFRTKWQEGARRSHPNLVFATFAQNVEEVPDADGVLNVEYLGMAGAGVTAWPARLVLRLLVKVRFFPEDIGSTHHFEARIGEASGGLDADVLMSEFAQPDIEPVSTGHPHHPFGIMPGNLHGAVALELHSAGHFRLDVTMNGELLAQLPFTIEDIAGQPFAAPPEWLPAT